VRYTTATRPPQPTTARVMAAGRTDLTDGEDDSNSFYSQRVNLLAEGDSIT
jgi:hypothetical protein